MYSRAPSGKSTRYQSRELLANQCGSTESRNTLPRDCAPKACGALVVRGSALSIAEGGDSDACGDCKEMAGIHGSPERELMIGQSAEAEAQRGRIKVVLAALRPPRSLRDRQC